MSNVNTISNETATDISARDSIGNSIKVDLIANKVVYSVYGQAEQSIDLFLADSIDWIYRRFVGSQINREQLSCVVAAAKQRHSELRLDFIAKHRAAVAAAWRVAAPVGGPIWELDEAAGLDDFALDPVYFCGPDGKTSGWTVWNNGGIFCRPA